MAEFGKFLAVGWCVSFPSSSLKASTSDRDTNIILYVAQLSDASKSIMLMKYWRKKLLFL